MMASLIYIFIAMAGDTNYAQADIEIHFISNDALLVSAPPCMATKKCVAPPLDVIRRFLEMIILSGDILMMVSQTSALNILAVSYVPLFIGDVAGSACGVAARRNFTTALFIAD